MAVKGITVDTASAASPHIYAYDQALINNALTGGDAVHEMFDNLLATKVSNNIVTISPGVFSIQGHFANVVYGTTEPMTIENGTAGQKRNDLICAKFKRTVDTDEISLVVVKGSNHPTTPVDPTIVQQDLLTGGTERLVALWRVVLDGINITTLTQLFTLQKNLIAFKDSLAPSIIAGDGYNYLVQTVNGFRTVTSIFTFSQAFTYSPSTNTYFASAFVDLPVGARFLSDANFILSTVSGGIYSAQAVTYNYSKGRLSFYTYCHASVETAIVSIQLLATGRI